MKLEALQTENALSGCVSSVILLAVRAIASDTLQCTNGNKIKNFLLSSLMPLSQMETDCEAIIAADRITKVTDKLYFLYFFVILALHILLSI